MRQIALCLVLVLVAASGCVSVQKAQPCQTSACPRAAAPAQVLRHVVLIKFKDGTSPEDIRAVEAAFCALPSKVAAIYDFEWGTDVSPENLANGFTHCFFLSFKSEEDRAVYLPHPAHKEFGSILGPHLDKVIVVDYWATP
ncbi:MAG: Dabb family protein [bacterium]|nr:Dabb family protein [bacterium]